MILERERTDAECPRLRPLNDMVYVRQERIPDQAGRFYIPDSARMGKQVRYGRVLAVGPGRLVCYQEETLDYARSDDGEFKVAETEWITKRIPPAVKVGDRVAFPDYWGICVLGEKDPSLLIGPASGEDGLLMVMEEA